MIQFDNKRGENCNGSHWEGVEQAWNLRKMRQIPFWMKILWFWVNLLVWKLLKELKRGQKNIKNLKNMVWWIIDRIIPHIKEGVTPLKSLQSSSIPEVYGKLLFLCQWCVRRNRSRHMKSAFSTFLNNFRAISGREKGEKT